MSDLVRRKRARRAGVALGTVLALLTSVPPPSVEAATDRLPDLRAAMIRDLRIVRTASGRRLLRFTTMMWNAGAGPFEVRAARPSTSSTWDVDQVVYDDAGGARRIETDAQMAYAGDGHDHWHIRRMASYHLWGSPGTFRDSKIGFCFFDTNLVDGDLPRSPSSRVYRETTCGSRSSLAIRSGISVGWGDRYPWNFAYQYIDISRLPGGTYTLRSAVDMYQDFTERSDSNNCSWVKVRFGSSGTGVTVLGKGWTCVNDYGGTVFETAVTWARSNKVATGCDGDLFCTYNMLTRGAAATFLARAMDLPAATRDYFDDDDGNTHESNINRLAEAGLASSCASRRYCPTSTVNRGSGAAFVARALGLEPVEDDYYTDTAGSSYETAINTLAAAGIATGCGQGKFCPTRGLIRGTWARWVYGAFGSS